MYIIRNKIVGKFDWQTDRLSYTVASLLRSIYSFLLVDDNGYIVDTWLLWQFVNPVEG